MMLLKRRQATAAAHAALDRMRDKLDFAVPLRVTSTTVTSQLLAQMPALAGALVQRWSQQRLAKQTVVEKHGQMLPQGEPAVGADITVKAARRLNRAAGLLAASVLVDSGMEHYRGTFHNRNMDWPLLSASLSLAASLHGHRDRRHGAHLARDGVYALAGAAGVAGTGFHLYNVTKRVGGFSWQNLFYAAPLGAPAALSLSGLVGFMAERVRDNRPGTVPRMLGLPAGRLAAMLTGAGLLGTVGEAGLLHFRGAFQNPGMLLPVTLPPITAGLLANTALGRARRNRRLTRWALRLTAFMGYAGVLFHAYGVGRSMGGWRNWRQNLFAGPPLPAPPAFAGLALAGLAALGLLEDHPDA